MFQWDLVCDDSALSQLPQTLAMIGMMVGAASLPQIGDKFGRKPVLVAFSLLHAVVMLAMAFSTNFHLFLALKFLSGSFNQVMYLLRKIKSSLNFWPLFLAKLKS